MSLLDISIQGQLMYVRTSPVIQSCPENVQSFSAPTPHAVFLRQHILKLCTSSAVPSTMLAAGGPAWVVPRAAPGHSARRWLHTCVQAADTPSGGRWGPGLTSPWWRSFCGPFMRTARRSGHQHSTKISCSQHVTINVGGVQGQGGNCFCLPRT